MNTDTQARILGGILLGTVAFTVAYIEECRKARKLKILNARLQHPAKGKSKSYNPLPELKGIEAQVSELNDKLDELIVAAREIGEGPR